MNDIPDSVIPTVERALADPLSFEVCFNLLGWTLAFTGESLATLISEEDALKIISAIKEKK